jgi:G protein-coupled receptor GPR1
MIAVHSALYIFKPRSSGEGGLYPYRRIAYTIWTVFPLIMASLAFIDNNSPYVGDGTYCYLPVRPLWYSLVLSWAPRYLIFIVILGVYASIYYYVQYKFSGFTKLNKRKFMSPNDKSRAGSDNPRKATTQSVSSSAPTLSYHHSTQDSRHSSRIEYERRKYSVSTTCSFDQVPISPQPKAHLSMLESFISASNSEQHQAVTSAAATTDINSPIVSSAENLPSPHVASTSTSPLSQSIVLPNITSPEPPSSPGRVHYISCESDQRPYSRRSMVDIFTPLSQRPGGTDTPVQVSALQLVNSRRQNIAISDMINTREKIQRQLRYLFIYPLVYIGMWMVPLVCQILQYDNRFASNLPFGLSCVRTICICSQAAVDCWLFSTREKPWRHISRSNGSFTSSLRFWSGWKDASEMKIGPRPGRTRDEVVREVRAAYRRRDEEMAERRSDVSQAELAGDVAARTERMWWDCHTGLMMTPVSEEITNPMNDVLTAHSSPPDLEAVFEEFELQRPEPTGQREGRG